MQVNKPEEYASKTLTEMKVIYSQIEKEILAIVLKVRNVVNIYI